MDKKEYKKAVKILEEEPTSFADIFNKIGALAVIDNLIEEHFDPKPYKFEELKVGMLVWDDKNEDCRQIASINEYGGIYWYGALSEYEADKFEENRFFPVTKAKGE